MFTPSAARRSMFSDHRGGMENSMAASTPAEVLRVMPSKFALLNSSSFSVDREAVFRRKLFDQPAHLSVSDDGEFHELLVEHRRIEFREELGVQQLHGARQVLLRDHEGQVQPRSALRDHPHVDRVQRRGRRAPATPGV